MRLIIKVKPRSSSRKVEKLADGSYVVSLFAPAHKNRANQELIEVLAEYFDISPGRIEIVMGLKSRRKVINISTENTGNN
ncbi:MAG: hypothetical protein A2Y84_01045 [Candidatus Colwellbacteria bacterium RBG_13_48_8]|uniref:Uncharacterized protein n=1 Tax=Candidatus Colwellbacteria bacterium RBG_13_48_8 TaxID=1797685 RepID=A0A1G1YX35_9BACT|nr:MAG: hypothetical protein A2Y84_01045 [Candidatus Colwellbacteria bacterium RBG_13_48_8]